MGNGNTCTVCHIHRLVWEFFTQATAGPVKSNGVGGGALFLELEQHLAEPKRGAEEVMTLPRGGERQDPQPPPIHED